MIVVMHVCVIVVSNLLFQGPTMYDEFVEWILNERKNNNVT